MQIQDLEKLAENAKIELSEEEKDKLLLDLKGILKYVKMIEEVEIDDSEYLPQVHNKWREDDFTNSAFSRDLLISQFPDSQDGFLKVKKIL